jgi:hypothetical protein
VSPILIVTNSQAPTNLPPQPTQQPKDLKKLGDAREKSMGWKLTSDHVSEGFFTKPAKMQKMSKKTTQSTKL